MDSNWAIVILTGVLAVITAWYAYSNHRYVKLFEDDRKRRVIKELAEKIFLPLRSQLRDEKYGFMNNMYISKIFPYENKIWVTLFERGTSDSEPISKYIENEDAKILLVSKDNILDRRLPKIQELCRAYDENVEKLKELIKNIAESIPDEFISFLEKTLEQHGDRKLVIQFRQNRLEFTLTLLRDILLQKERLHPNNIFSDFWKEYGRQVYSEFLKIDVMREKMEQLSQIRDQIIEIAEELLIELQELLKEWKKKYELTGLELQAPDELA
ncbi:hypothetical protein DRO97_10200, partial [Archaeoglobales archaeon]